MGIFRRKKKDENKERKKLPFDIDWRITPEEYLRLAFFSSLLIFTVAWSSIIASSLLYLLAIGGLIIAFLNYRDALIDRFKLIVPFLVGMFFLLFSLSGNRGAYIAGAYLSSLLINIVGYWAVKDAIIDEARGRDEKWQ